MEKSLKIFQVKSKAYYESLTKNRCFQIFYLMWVLSLQARERESEEKRKKIKKGYFRDVDMEGVEGKMLTCTVKLPNMGHCG